MALHMERMDKLTARGSERTTAAFPRMVNRTHNLGRSTNRNGISAVKQHTLSCCARDRKIRSAHLCCASGTFSPSDGDVEKEESFPTDIQVPTTCMAQLSSSGGATMQKSKLNLTQEVRISQPKTDDAGGGGDIGNRIFNGGGGDGDDSDDDEYQDDFGDDGDEDPNVGLFDIREALPELFDRATMDALLSEWYKTVVSLPAGLRMAVEMSVISSAQLVRFLSMDYRPKLSRTLMRALPTEPSRAFVGRLMGDPTFMYKVVLEQFLTITGSVLCELKVRGSNFKKEWKEVVANTTALCVANASMIWLTAPSRTFGSTSKFAWQRTLGTLPNHVFEKSGPLRRYTTSDRALALLFKSGQLGLVGLASGMLGVGLNKLAMTEEKSKEAQQSTKKALALRGPVIGLGAQMALSSLVRYQGIAGVDRWLGQRCGHLTMVLGGTTAMRVANAGVGEFSRLWFQGVNPFQGGGGKSKTKRRRPKKMYRKSSNSSGSMSFASTAVTARAM